MAAVCILIVFVGVFSTVNGEEGFYNIAHMTNTPNSVNWALDKGANAVELDLNFDSSSGSPLLFRHSKAGEACDCSCLCPAPIWWVCSFLYPNTVCAKLLGDVRGMSPCRAESSMTTMLNFLAKKSSLALVIIDSKIDSDDMDSNKMKSAGGMVVSSLIKQLFQAGYGGKVIIGSPKLDTLPYLQAAVGALQGSQYQSRVYFTIDLEKNNIVNTLKELHKLPTRNIVYGTGITICLSASTIKQSTMELAALNKAKGVTGLTYLWTVDKESTLKDNLPFIQGVLSNTPGMVNKILRENGIKLATQSSIIPQATSSDVITSSEKLKCDCDYHPGGCSISRPAPSGMACHCEYKGAWTCGGSVSQCRNPSSHYCSNPDYSVQSCLLGGGDCEGYKSATCDCDYHRGGCSISQAPPPTTACRCSYKGFWTCGGSITRCKDFNSHYCSFPDKSIYTCRLGGGDCDGY